MSSTTTYPLYPAAIVLPLLSIIAFLLCLPPLIWHLRAHNVGPSSLIAWLLLLNVINVINALLWPRDDLSTWWHGAVLCDIEARLFVGNVAGAGALACIMRSLARVMDTENAAVTPSKAQRRRERVLELLLCFAVPVWLMGVQYIVQDRRYYVFGISGCATSLDQSWLSVVLVFIWPVVIALLDAYYAGLVIFRLRRYRSQIAHILQLSNTTKARFMRLFLISLLLICFFVPIQLYTFYLNVNGTYHAYSWATVHDPQTWNQTILVPSGGTVLYDRWVSPVCGILVFAFLGVGTDAVRMYRGWLRAVGMEKMWNGLAKERDDAKSSFFEGPVWRSVGSKAKLLFARRSSGAGGKPVDGPLSSGETSVDTALSGNSHPKKSYSLQLTDLSADSHETLHEDVATSKAGSGKGSLWKFITSTRRDCEKE